MRFLSWWQVVGAYERDRFTSEGGGGGGTGDADVDAWGARILWGILRITRRAVTSGDEGGEGWRNVDVDVDATGGVWVRSSFDVAERRILKDLVGSGGQDGVAGEVVVSMGSLGLGGGEAARKGSGAVAGAGVGRGSCRRRVSSRLFASSPFELTCTTTGCTTAAGRGAVTWNPRRYQFRNSFCAVSRAHLEHPGHNETVRDVTLVVCILLGVPLCTTLGPFLAQLAPSFDRVLGHWGLRAILCASHQLEYTPLDLLATHLVCRLRLDGH